MSNPTADARKFSPGWCVELVDQKRALELDFMLAWLLKPTVSSAVLPVPSLISSDCRLCSSESLNTGPNPLKRR